MVPVWIWVTSLVLQGSCAASLDPAQVQIELTDSPVCSVSASQVGGDDGPAIAQAFQQCGKAGKIVLPDELYHINSILNTVGLKDVQIELRGRLEWSKDIQYWLANSMPIGYQNQSTVWYLGGDNIRFEGFGTGTFDGNGQTWYDFVNGTSNYPRRPMGLTIVNTTNSVFQGLRFVQSQMWTMTVLRSQNVLLQDIYVNSTSAVKRKGTNTDGADTLFSDNITFRRWTVANGDDGISIKANSTRITIEDSTFYGGAVALGSIGQYPVYETIEDVVVRNITYNGGFIPIYAKTWTGVQMGYPPNGGGGGTGTIRNITATDMKLSKATAVFLIGQCVHWSSGGIPGNCDTSEFLIQDINISNVTGNVMRNVIADMKCSPKAPCPRISFNNINVITPSGTKATRFLCENVIEPIGFSCS